MTKQEDYEKTLVQELYHNMCVDSANEELYDKLQSYLEGKPSMVVIDTIKVLLMSACKDGIDQSRTILTDKELNGGV